MVWVGMNMTEGLYGIASDGAASVETVLSSGSTPDRQSFQCVHQPSSSDISDP